MTVAFLKGADDRAFGRIQGSEQRRSTLGFVVVGLGRHHLVLSQRQARLPTIQCLGLAFFIAA